MRQQFHVPHFDTEAILDEISRNSRFRSRLLWQSGDYCLVPSISPLIEGHVLLLPRKPFTSLAASYDVDRDGFHQAFRAAYWYIARTYRTPMLFEHGAGSHETGGSSVSYAHLHLVPMDRYHRRAIASVVSHGFPLSDSGRLFTALASLPKDNAYLLCGDVGLVRYCQIETLPSQYLRRVVAETLQVSLWDWRELFNWDLFDQTIRRFRTGRSIDTRKEVDEKCSYSTEMPSESI